MPFSRDTGVSKKSVLQNGPESEKDRPSLRSALPAHRLNYAGASKRLIVRGSPVFLCFFFVLS